MYSSLVTKKLMMVSDPSIFCVANIKNHEMNSSK